jgi:hypothetical protein
MALFFDWSSDKLAASRAGPAARRMAVTSDQANARLRPFPEEAVMKVTIHYCGA